MGKAHLGAECSTARPLTPATWRCWSATARKEHKERWLKPLLERQIRSAFLMTEPDVASSDATNISMSCVRDGDEYVLNGEKWWSSGAGDPRCKIYIVMVKTGDTAQSTRSIR
jgi:acyl-CoA dehydrogenase